MAILHRGYMAVLYVAKANSDSLGVILLNGYRGAKLPDINLSPLG